MYNLKKYICRTHGRNVSLLVADWFIRVTKHNDNIFQLFTVYISVNYIRSDIWSVTELALQKSVVYKNSFMHC